MQMTDEDLKRLESIIRVEVKRIIERCLVNDSERPEYNNWQGMKRRCYYQKHEHFKYYGGRGIKVCERWINSFQNFYRDMGPRPTPKHSIDRIDSNGDYSPSNCRWATPHEQIANQTKTIYANVDGERVSLRELARRSGLKFGTLYSRLVLWGWSLDEALNTGLHGRWRRRGS